MNFNFFSLTSLAKVFSFLIVTLAIVGGFNYFSNVPYWDMWDGYLGFYSHIAAGDYSAWWAQHNEHRVVLSKLFFWVTFKLFNGHAAFLIVVNYLLVILTSYLFYLFLSKISSERREAVSYKGVFISLLVSLLFFWSQKENFTWAFQSQFFLAFNIPLASFYFFSKYLTGGKNTDFSLSALLGLLSVGTMANGILVLPLLVVIALFYKLNYKYTLFLLLLSVLSFVGYFHGYESPGNHSSVTQAVLHEPLSVLRYVMRYIGSPMYHIMNGGELGAISAEILGGIYILISLLTAFSLLKKFRTNQYQAGLLFFVIYIGGTAFGSAGGRVIFGLGQAFSNRYTTPAVMAWVALFILNYYAWNAVYKRFGNKFTYVVIFVLGILLIRQLDAAFPNTLVLFERKVSALSVELGVKDQVQVAQMGPIYPSAEALDDISKYSIANNLSIFSEPYIKNSKQRMNSEFISGRNYTSCIGALDTVRVIQDNYEYWQVRGWVFEPISKKIPKGLIFVKSNKVLGFALVGAIRSDVATAIDKNALYSGFKGYLSVESKGTVTAYTEQQPFCKFSLPEIVGEK